VKALLRIFADQIQKQMKNKQGILISFIVLILIAALYRIMPRPWGFAPQVAMALFGGAVIADKRVAFALPILSMFISDLIYQVLYNYGGGEIPGFYEGQVTNYILFALLTVLGFALRDLKVWKIASATIVAPVLFFLASNFFVWQSGGGFKRPHTFAGLIQCYNDALPFFRGSLMGTAFFSVLLFGGYFLVRKYRLFSATTQEFGV